MRCRRCEESPDYDREQLAVHAEQAQHPLCAVCSRSLAHTEPQTCGRCLDRVRGHLDDIADAWQRLQDTAGWPVGGRRTMPGGDMLVLAGPGSDGRTQQTGVWTGGGWTDGHRWDENPTDPPAVAHTLAVWAGQWYEQRTRLTPALDLPVDALFDLAHGYLTQHLQWAANAHPAIADFAGEMWQLRRRMRATLGLDNQRVTGAPCLRCSTPQDPVHLERLWTDAGLADVWCCQRCGDTLTPAQYLLALRGALEAS